MISAAERVQLKAEWGCPQQVLSRDQCLQLEPALADWNGEFAGGLYSRLDEAGDAYLFTEGLAQAATRSGARFDFDTLLHQWSGLRPATPDSAPVLGTTPYENLYLNTGQGMLGWTLACGSASVVADVIDGYQPQIDLTGLTLQRFS